MSRLFLIAAALMLLSVAPAAAQRSQAAAPSSMQSGGSGTDEDRKACGPDAMKLCKNVLEQGDFAVLDCFQRQRARLSRVCEAVLRRYGQ
jgi:hypothetical protein